jgi:hypothetical protein
VISCGKSVTEKSSEGEAGNAGEPSGGVSAMGGTSNGGRAAGGTSGANIGGANIGGTNAGRGGTGAGRGGTAPTGGLGGAAGEPQGGQAGEGTAGAGGDDGGCTGPVGITSESDLIAFAAKHCEVLDGSLTITSPTLTSLNALAPSTLRVITGTLTIDGNPVLDNLEGLSGLEEIGHSFILQSSYISDVLGLETLRSIGSNTASDTLVIAANPRLADIEPLGGVTRLLLTVVVSGNNALTGLAGIGNLTTTTNVTIVNNPALTEIGGFNDLEVAQNLTVASNPALMSAVFPALRVGGSLSITGNELLESVSLPALGTAQTLTIAGNPVLETVGTLDSLTSVDLLIIAGNSQLPQCFVDALDARLMACDMSCGGNDMTAVCN